MDWDDDKVLERIRIALKNLRKDNNVGIEDFYNDTGIHIGRVETSTSNITIITLNKICTYYNISIQTFFADYY